VAQGQELVVHINHRTLIQISLVVPQKL
jgi:hypothetical protein